nr:NADPH:quinone reductase [Sphingomonas sp. CDS-1]
MQIVYYDRQGPAGEVLSVGDQPMPVPAAGEVLVKLAFSGINPSDIKHRSGQVGTMAYPRIIPHQDGSGVIEAVGAGVSPDRVGQRVWLFEAQSGRAFGTAAEYIALSQDKAVPLPAAVSLEVGASIGVPALTAHRCLFNGHMLLGRRILVHGGMGAVGRAAVQLARWAGAWVCATVRREEQRAGALQAGADQVFDPADPDMPARIRAATEGKGVDLIVDVDVTTNLSADLACLATGGTISAYATLPGKTEQPAPSIVPTMVANATIRYVYVYTVPGEAKAAAVRDVSACLAEGLLDARIGDIYPLIEAAKAHAVVDQGNGTGRILLQIG